MKLCQTCDQLLAETITTCPSCGAEVDKGRQSIDDYRIIDVLHEGHASILCRAKKKDSQTPVMIRLFKTGSGLNDQVADRLKSRLEQLNALPEKGFVKHYEIKCTSDGLWYRVSEWVDGEDWSRIFASGLLKDTSIALDLFYQIALNLSILHETGHFIPHLILNDIIVVKPAQPELQIKIDYKLSRFLNGHPQMPGTMLDKLMKCHLDIVNKNPLDFRSDIWSLGKVFVELLTADLDTSPTLEKVDTLPFSQKGKTLLKVMLAEDPSMRPRSMKEVATFLLELKGLKIETVKKKRFEKVSVSFREVQKLRTRIWRLAALLSVLVVAGIVSVVYFEFFRKDVEARFRDYAYQYSDSVAFVMVEYSLKQGKTTIYKNRAEGTAFLVDDEGYLLTNRHVAAPWMVDRNLFIIIDQTKRQNIDLWFDYRMYLWFEGQKAYKHLPTLEDSTDLTDIYHLESAFRSDGKPRVSIVGIARSTKQQGYFTMISLKDDFAILKIDKVSEGLKPLPLEEDLNALDIPKLSPVITIGFPLGSRT